MIKKLKFILPDLFKWLGISVCFVIIIESLKLVPPYAIKIALDELVIHNSISNDIILAICSVLFASLISAFVESRYFKHSGEVGIKAELVLNSKSHKKLLSLDLPIHEDMPSGDITQLLIKGSMSVRDMLYFFQDQFLGAAFQTLITVVLLIIVHPTCGLLFLAFLPFTIGYINYSGKKIQPYRRRYHDQMRKAHWRLTQGIVNIQTVKNFAREGYEIKSYEKLIDTYTNLAIERVNKEESQLLVRDSFLSITRVCTIAVSVYFVSISSMSIGTLVLFTSLTEKVISSLYRLGRLYSFLGNSIYAIEELYELLKKEPIIKNSNDSELLSQKAKGKITFDNVTFIYPNSNNGIKEINFEVEDKSVVALVGKSGSGKSTLIKLLMRHYDPNLGIIKLDNTDIKKLNLTSYREQISIVPQDIELFDTTISENISFGRKSTKQEVIKAAKKACADIFIKNLPKGYETIVGERGIKLSGGQRQRIGIARALIGNPSVLVLDEATSSLDSESELVIQDALNSLNNTITIIIIAHRLSTVRTANNILVFKDGKIIERGEYSKLLETESVFKEMVKIQNSSF